MLSRHPHSTLRAVIRPAILSLFTALLSVACDGRKDLFAPGPTVSGTVTGTVTSSVTGSPVAGAKVRIGAAADTTGADGRFVLTYVTEGVRPTLRCAAVGFVDFATVITLTSGGVTHDIGLTRVEMFQFTHCPGGCEWSPTIGEFALYVPNSVAATRGLILALGGPDTRGFATGGPIGAPNPEVEASLQALGQEFRTLASTRGLAVLGTSLSAMTNDPYSDQFLLEVVQDAAAMSGRPELATAPLLLYGMSDGASGFTARNPERVAGLFLKVPSAVSSVTSGDVSRVPTYMVLAELDAFVDNAALTAAFEGKRGAGALWALAKEPGVPHHSLTPAQRQVTINWISTILELRLPATSSDPLREIAETSGWLGNRATGAAAPWATYPGDRASASWLPSETTAREWETFVAASGN
jgi:hypothetical protein